MNEPDFSPLEQGIATDSTSRNYPVCTRDTL